MKLSIVSTLYQSTPYIDDFYKRIIAIAKQLVGDDFEIIFVNDGSPDNSLELAIKISQIDSKVTVIDLSRNFGHHKAMMTGLTYAKGSQIFLIDSDLEEEPEWLSIFSHEMASKQCDVVYGIQGKRKGNWFERWSGQLFYYCFKAISGISLSENITTARLMTQRYVKALISHEEREVFIAGLWQITGFSQCPVLVKKHSSSISTYTLSKKISLVINSVTSFSNRPLIGIFYVGIFISFFSSLYIVYIILYWSMAAGSVSGWTSVMASIWLIGGMVISFIGIVGIYLSKIFIETKRRPYTIVRHIYGKKI